MTSNEEIAYKYAWDWFSYHAKQRITAFNYFILIISALIVGFSKANINEQLIYAFCGVIVSIAFFILDWRNTILVNDGRQALDTLERNNIYLKVLDIRGQDRRRKCLHPLIFHSVWFRTLITISFTIFLSFAVHHRSIIKQLTVNYIGWPLWLGIIIVLLNAYYVLSSKWKISE